MSYPGGSQATIVPRGRIRCAVGLTAHCRNGPPEIIVKRKRAGDPDSTITQETGGCLPHGYQLREFVIERVLGEGGFGVVYSAVDTKLERRVAIKEYMPSSLATREADLSLRVRASEDHRHAFEAGLRSFVNEARLLARFEHPALIKVYQFWEDKGTAYMVMPFYAAPTLKAWIKERGAPDEAWLAQLLLRLIDALEALHRAQCLHRDVAPDNILVLPDGAPLLLDFGAARRVIGDLTHALTAILKPGYAPVEQYAETATMKQGPWTDVYALCAVAYFTITGKAPIPAVGRVMNDELLPLRHIARGQYSDALLAALDAGLSVRPQDRPSSMEALRTLLTAAPRPRGEAREGATPGAQPHPRAAEAAGAGAASQPAHTSALRVPKAPQENAVAQGAVGELSKTARRWPLWTGGIALAAAVAIGVWFALLQRPAVEQPRATTPGKGIELAAAPAVTTTPAAIEPAAPVPAEPTAPPLIAPPPPALSEAAPAEPAGARYGTATREDRLWHDDEPSPKTTPPATPPKKEPTARPAPPKVVASRDAASSRAERRADKRADNRADNRSDNRSDGPTAGASARPGAASDSAAPTHSAALAPPPAHATAPTPAPAPEPKIDPKRTEQEINMALFTEKVHGVVARVDENLVVTLAGSATEQDRSRAVAIANRIKGVRSVRDEVFVPRR